MNKQCECWLSIFNMSRPPHFNFSKGLPSRALKTSHHVKRPLSVGLSVRFKVDPRFVCKSFQFFMRVRLASGVSFRLCSTTYIGTLIVDPDREYIPSHKITHNKIPARHVVFQSHLLRHVFGFPEQKIHTFIRVCEIFPYNARSNCLLCNFEV